MSIAKGTHVRITKGLAVGVVGIVDGPWSSLFGRGKDAVRQWIVRSDDLVRRRIMREDHLEPIPPTPALDRLSRALEGGPNASGAE